MQKYIFKGAYDILNNKSERVVLKINGYMFSSVGIQIY